MLNKNRVLLSIAVGLLTGCFSPTRVPPPIVAPTPSPQPPGELDVRGAVQYQVNPSASAVDILVYRGGTLARLGHNHVMTSKSVTGRVWLHPQLEKSGFELSFPVADLVVDDAEARRAAGTEFPPEIPQGDKDGTRRNMLRTEVLDAERFPQITLQSVRVAGSPTAPQITARITIKEASREVEVAAKVAIDGSRLTASGEFDIQQTDFGIKPFSVALGAIAVKDQLHIKFDLVADAR
jgi:polyisoprenoid-binding protein YceI